MERILNFLDKSTNGKCYKSFKYSLDDLEVPSLIYDDKPKIVLQPKAETDKRKQKYISVKEEAVNPEKPDVPLNKNDAFQKVQKRRVQEKR